MKNLLMILLLLYSTLPQIVYAHGDEEHNKEQDVKPDTFTVVNGDTIAVNNKPFKSSNEVSAETKKVKPFKLNPTEVIFEHLHNKIVHFPIAIGVLAFFFSLLHIRRKSYDATIFILVILGFAFSVAAFFTGNNQVQPFEGTNKYWVVELHRNFGIGIMIIYFIWLLFLRIEKIKKYAWIIGAVIFVLILITAFLGGVIAH